ncbi:MAG: Na+-transporting NADH:ubiquinone oxidoreductase, subunit NqrB [Alkalinema sp. RU_4_3]|nr:Na+-transporting NADH:ubiquinone oxidoreductase, subunit NqrB [Alkalinema sp. RU_4_3]
MLQDARLYQISFLSLFLLLGFATRDWTLHPVVVATALLTCCLSQWLGLYLVGQLPAQLPSSPEAKGQGLWPGWAAFFSPVITALGLAILLRVDGAWMMAIASVAAIASKFLFRWRDKHLWNPSNFGIIAALLLPGNAWVSPGQWGESVWYVLMFLACGGLVVRKVGRLDTTVAFLVSYGVLEALRNLYLGWTWDVWGHRLGSGSLVMFSFFMITDPRTIPDSWRARVLWAFSIAVVTFGLRNFYFLNTAVFWALFCISPVTVLLDALWQGDRFVWRRSPELLEEG